MKSSIAALAVQAPALRAMLLVGLAYCAVGVVLGLLAGRAASHQGVVAWRWAAWAVSALLFGAHILYEQLRLRTSPRTTALHVACAAALGAFGLAVAANVHGLTVPPYRHSGLVILALAIWPVMTAVPAFIVALVAAGLLTRDGR